jgi:hypothetical protein
MAWTNIANANLDVGAPIRSVDILALRDNVSAVPNGDTGAPRIRAEALNGGQSGNAPIFAARAWVNFDGTGTFSPNPSTSAIRGSGNVSSIARNGTGYFTINLAVALQDTNYSAVGTCSSDTDGSLITLSTYSRSGVSTSKTTSSFVCFTRAETRFDRNPSFVEIIVLR